MPENLNLNFETYMLETANIYKLFSDFHMHLHIYMYI